MNIQTIDNSENDISRYVYQVVCQNKSKGNRIGIFCRILDQNNNEIAIVLITSKNIQIKNHIVELYYNREEIKLSIKNVSNKNELSIVGIDPEKSNLSNISIINIDYSLIERCKKNEFNDKATYLLDLYFDNIICYNAGIIQEINFESNEIEFLCFKKGQTPGGFILLYENNIIQLVGIYESSDNEKYWKDGKFIFEYLQNFYETNDCTNFELIRRLSQKKDENNKKNNNKKNINLNKMNYKTDKNSNNINANYNNNINNQYNQSINNNNMNYPINQNLNKMNIKTCPNSNVNMNYQINQNLNNNNINYQNNQNIINGNFNNQNNQIINNNNMNAQNMAINNSISCQNNQNINSNLNMNNQGINNNINQNLNNNINNQFNNNINQNLNNNINQNLNNNINNQFNNNLNYQYNNGLNKQYSDNINNQFINNMNNQPNNYIQNIKNQFNQSINIEQNDDFLNYERRRNNTVKEATPYSGLYQSVNIQNMNPVYNNQINNFAYNINMNLNYPPQRNFNIQNLNQMNKFTQSVSNSISKKMNELSEINSEDIYPYINENKFNISFKNNKNEIKNVLIPVSLRNSELYYTADKINNPDFFEYSDVNSIQLYINNQSIPNNDYPISQLVYNGAQILIKETIEDLSYYNSIFQNCQNTKIITICFNNNNGKMYSLNCPYNIKVKDMILGFFSQYKIPKENRQYFSFLYSSKLLNLNNDNILINEKITNGCIISLLTSAINNNNCKEIYSKKDLPGKKLKVSLKDKNDQLIGEMFAGSLQQIKTFYEKLKKYLSEKERAFTGKPVIISGVGLTLNESEVRTFSTFGILNDFSVKLME